MHKSQTNSREDLLIPPDDCTCAHLCPDGDCIAIYVHDKHECWLLCSTGDSVAPNGKLSPDTRLNIETRGIELAHLGEFLDRHCDTELFVPAAAARTRVTLRMEYATLSAVIEQAGLVTGDGRPSQRGSHP